MALFFNADSDQSINCVIIYHLVLLPYLMLDSIFLSFVLMLIFFHVNPMIRKHVCSLYLLHALIHLKLPGNFNAAIGLVFPHTTLQMMKLLLLQNIVDTRFASM